MRLRSLLVAIVVVLALTGATATAVAAPASATTVLSMQEGANMRDPYPDGGGAVVFTGDTVDTTVTTTYVYVSAFDPTTPQSGTDGAGIIVHLPAGSTFSAGSTYSLGSGTGADEDSTSWGHLGCTVSSGSLTVLEATVDGSGTVTAFAADFSTACLTGTTARGSIRINSAVAYAGAVATPGITGGGYDKLAIGDTRTLHATVTSAGSSPLVLGQAAVDTDTTGIFTIGADGCSGQQLAVGASCTVDLVARPLDPVGVVTAVLRIPSASLTRLEFGIEFDAADPDRGTYHRTTAYRILDTRNGTGGTRQPVAGGQHITVTAPTGATASAVVVNLTVTNPTVAGYVTAYPTGGTRPATSSINFVPGQTVANLVTVPVSADGSFDLFNAFGRTDLVVDLLGWYAADDFTVNVPRGGGFHPARSQRLLDTRSWGYGSLLPGDSALVPVKYSNDGGRIAALSVNITATDVTGVGYVSATDSYSGVTTTSALNVTPGVTVANAAVVPTTSCPVNGDCSKPAAWVELYNGTSGSIDLILDVNGYYDDGNLPATIRYRPLAAPTRIVDTRLGQGLVRFGPGQTQTLQPGTNVAGYDTWALDTNLTGISHDASTFVTAWPAGFSDYPQPTTSVINPSRGQVVANHATTEVGPGNRVNYYNLTGRLDLVLDVDGTFEQFPATPADQQGKARPATVLARPAFDAPAARPVAAR